VRDSAHIALSASFSPAVPTVVIPPESFHAAKNRTNHAAPVAE
jgi:hypothetical protein